MGKDNAKNKPVKYNPDSKKFNDWVEYFLDKKNKETYGNLTQSAIRAYMLDPKEQYDSASTIGSENYRKLRHLASMYAETKGLGFGKMLDIATQKMLVSKTPEWWDRLMKLFGYADFMEKGTVVAQQFNVNGLADLIKKQKDKYGI